MPSLFATPGTNDSDTSVTDGTTSIFGDIIAGLNGNDTIFAHGGDDTILGGDGNDTIHDLKTFGFGSGDDSICGGNGNDHVFGRKGSDRIDGGTGTDTVDYRNSSSAVQADLAFSWQSGGVVQGDRLFSIENVTGSDYAETLTGNAMANDLRGLGGNDRCVLARATITFMAARTSTGPTAKPATTRCSAATAMTRYKAAQATTACRATPATMR